MMSGGTGGNQGGNFRGGGSVSSQYSGRNSHSDSRRRSRSRSPSGHRRGERRSRSPDGRSRNGNWGRDRDWGRSRDRDRDRDRDRGRGRADDRNRSVGGYRPRNESPGSADRGQQPLTGGREGGHPCAAIAEGTVAAPPSRDTQPDAKETEADAVVYGEEDLSAINSFLAQEDDDSDDEDLSARRTREAEEREMEQRRLRREEIKRKYEAAQRGAAVAVPDVTASAVAVTATAVPTVPQATEDPIAGSPAKEPETGEGDRYAAEGDRLEKELQATAEFEGSRAESSSLDMFSLSPTVQPAPSRGSGMGAKTASQLALATDYSDADNPHLRMEWDDGEGYYRARVGEVLGGRYRTLGVLGKGVFSSVLKCVDLAADVDAAGKCAAASNAVSVVAVKMIRSNDVMKKASEKELAILSKISKNDPERRKHCVVLLNKLEYRNHTALVFEHQSMNLRETIKKFGKGVGISVTAVRVYARQLFVALRYLRDLDIVHADIKPDNILISDDLKQVKICDFGSAFYTHDADSCTPTPYLVSRFYRAPEIILGLTYDHAIDVWGIGSVLYELFTGHVMFPGRSNNDMLRLMMLTKGRLSNKLIKTHIKAYEGLQMEPHFATDGHSVEFKFKQYEKDPVSEKLHAKLVDVNIHPTVQLSTTLLGAKAGSDDRKTVGHLIDLLEKAFSLDPARRLTVSDALKHPIFAAPGASAPPPSIPRANSSGNFAHA